jgi:hypothetical protein
MKQVESPRRTTNQRADARRSPVVFVIVALATSTARADQPHVSYIFPAGGQRGTGVDVRIGGHNLHDAARLHIDVAGVHGPERIVPAAETIWFEGPLIPQPASQQKEDYPRDYAARLTIDADAPLGPGRWRVSTVQGVTSGLLFVVGDLPEVVEEEIDGDALPTPVMVPVTINGRIFPREDVDLWTFPARAGRTCTLDVCAARLGSPLCARLVVQGPDGRAVAEGLDTVENDPQVRFTADRDGDYTVRIQDIESGGLQHYVYRLTISDAPHLDWVYPPGGRRGTTAALELHGPGMPPEPLAVELPVEGTSYIYRPTVAERAAGSVRLDLDDLPEQLEVEPNDTAASLPPVSEATVVNGRIDRAGDVDQWAIQSIKDVEYVLEVRASRWGSPVDSVISVLDADGKELATADDAAAGVTDALLRFKAPADGVYRVQVRDQFGSRGGPEFTYRLRIAAADKVERLPRIEVPTDAVIVERGKEASLKVTVVRPAGFADAIEITVAGLPEGVIVEGTSVAAGAGSADLKFKAATEAHVAAAPLHIGWTATINGQQAAGRGIAPRRPEELASDVVWLSVAIPTPFKFVGQFESKFVPRGTVHVRHYTLERGGFEGPIEVRLADRQVRHLQGMTGPALVIPAGVNEFDYPVTLPSWLDLGRTSRTCLMAVGVLEEPDGSRATVSYTSHEQNDQIIILTAPQRLSVAPLMPTLREVPGGSASVPVRIERAAGLDGDAVVSLDVPAHIHGVHAEPVTIPAGQADGRLELQFDGAGRGPFNQPVTIRATTPDERGFRVTAEADLIVVE